MAYVACDAIGLDTGEESFAYFARWSEEESERVRDTAERVICCAKQIFGALDAIPDGVSTGDTRTDIMVS